MKQRRFCFGVAGAAVLLLLGVHSTPSSATDSLRAPQFICCSIGFVGPVHPNSMGRPWITNYPAAVSLGLDSIGTPVLRRHDGVTLWRGSVSAGPTSQLAVLQDGNVVLYDQAGVPRWATGTTGAGSWLQVQSNGVLSVFRPVVRWNSNTADTFPSPALPHHYSMGIPPRGLRLDALSAPFCSADSQVCLRVTSEGNVQIVRGLYSQSQAAMLSEARSADANSVSEYWIKFVPEAPPWEPPELPPGVHPYRGIPARSKLVVSADHIQVVSRSDTKRILPTTQPLNASTLSYLFFTTLYSPGAYLVFQEDGNLVLYSQSGTPLWATGTHGATDEQWWQLRNDGNLVLTRGVSTWASNTAVQPAAKMPPLNVTPSWALSLPPPNRGPFHYPNSLSYGGFNP
jgi:hypothetical protein